MIGFGNIEFYKVVVVDGDKMYEYKIIILVIFFVLVGFLVYFNS